MIVFGFGHRGEQSFSPHLECSDSVRCIFSRRAWQGGPLSLNYPQVQVTPTPLFTETNPSQTEEGELMRGLTEWDKAVLLCLTPLINLFPLQVCISMSWFPSPPLSFPQMYSQNCLHISSHDLSTNLANITALSSFSSRWWMWRFADNTWH